jgi:hypothetical protein
MRYNEYTAPGFDIEKMEYDARKAATGRHGMGWARHEARDGLDTAFVSVGYDPDNRIYEYAIDGVRTPRDQVAALLVNLRAA